MGLRDIPIFKIKETEERQEKRYVTLSSQNVIGSIYLYKWHDDNRSHIGLYPFL